MAFVDLLSQALIVPPIGPSNMVIMPVRRFWNSTNWRRYTIGAGFSLRILPIFPHSYTEGCSNEKPRNYGEHDEEFHRSLTITSVPHSKSPARHREQKECDRLDNIGDRGRPFVRGQPRSEADSEKTREDSGQQQEAPGARKYLL